MESWARAGFSGVADGGFSLAARPVPLVPEVRHCPRGHSNPAVTSALKQAALACSRPQRGPPASSAVPEGGRSGRESGGGWLIWARRGGEPQLVPLGKTLAGDDRLVS